MKSICTRVGCQALEALQRAVTTLPEDEHLAIQAGLLAFKIKKFDIAYQAFNSTLAGTLTPHVTAVRDLFLARCLDLKGKRKEALAVYKRHVENSEPRLARAFKSALRRPYRQRDIKSMVVDFHFPDAFEY